MLDGGSAVWAHGDLPAAKALAVRYQLRVSRELVQMRRPTADPLPAPELPDGVRIRTFVPGVDDASFLAVNARAFSWHPEQGRLDQAGLDREMAQDWFDPTGFFLAVDADDRLLGYHWTKVHDHDPTPAADTDGTAPAGPSARSTCWASIRSRRSAGSARRCRWPGSGTCAPAAPPR